MQKPVKLPLNPSLAGGLFVGDEVLLSGPVYTMRDAGHQRCLDYLKDHGELPFGLQGQTLFYAGPTPAAAGRPVGAVGPTTASRMDFATPTLLQAGIKGMIGKGVRSQEITQACAEHGALYFCAVGGAAALLAKCVVEVETIAWEDLGTEALRKFVLKDFPAFVAIDIYGGDIYRGVSEGLI